MTKWRNLTAAFLGIAGLAIGGLAIAWLQPADAQGARGELVASGSFIQADPDDALHWGKGGVRVYRDRVEMDADFAVGVGPKYRVFLVLDKDIKKTADISTFRLIDIGRLRHFTGAQSYELPRGIDIARFGSVVIYCEGFKVLISPATLTAAG